jgi:hypothetical protein
MHESIDVFLIFQWLSKDLKMAEVEGEMELMSHS